jgi:AcrR family transcriptional regulator
MASHAQPTRRADARRNIERILDAALAELTHDPEASMGAVARRAGVARATLYVHFPTREALIDAVTERAIAESAEAIRSADPDAGEPDEALARILRAAWRMLGRYHALVAIKLRREHDELTALHEPVLGLLRPVVERGRTTGAFNPDVPAEWLLTVLLELVHAASRDVSAGRLADDVAERALVATALGAVSGRTSSPA